MTQEPESNETRPDPPPLKVVEQEPDPEKPWADDVLEREDIARRLTRIVEGQGAPFVISVDGGWGTGKTFLLKRWQKDLERENWQAVYFNAWEDDFSDDPLLAIIGQLAEHFDDGRFQKIVRGVANAGLAILTKHLTGTAIKLDDLKGETLLDEYARQQETKRKVRAELGLLATEVREDTGQPLVFIIDELDRCRPTFAIELLERVKHIFDVPNIVFVFGINRSELVKSLQSVYGEIEASIYVRRFFDMEFILPEADPARFCKSLIRTYRLDALFDELSSQARNDFHLKEFGEISEELPIVFKALMLSLRDMEYCLRLLALAGRDLQQGYTLYPSLISLLISVKICDPILYRRIVQGDARGAEVIDYLNELHTVQGSDFSHTMSRERHVLNCIEAAVYSADDAQVALTQLRLLKAGGDLTQPQYIARETASLSPSHEMDSERLGSLIELVEHYGSLRRGYDSGLRYLSQRIDIYSGMTRR